MKTIPILVLLSLLSSVILYPCNHNDKKITLIPSGVEGIYDVLEDGKFIQAMTVNEVRVYFGIQ